MNFIETLICYIVMIIIQYIYIECYKLISHKNIMSNQIKLFLIIILTSMISLVNNIYIVSSFKIVISILMLFLLFQIVFKDKMRQTFLTTVLIYIFLLIIDMCLSIIFVSFPVNSMMDIGNVSIIKALFSTIVSLLMLLIINFKTTRKLIQKIIKILNHRQKIIDILVIISLLLFSTIAIVNATNFNYEIYIVSVIIAIVFSIFSVTIVTQYIKVKNTEHKQEVLLNFMSKYEQLLERDRINRHEMLNNLLILKSFKNKNTLEYEKLLESLINNYQHRKTGILSNLYKLPQGLKGIIYYRINSVNNLGINIVVNIDKGINKIIKKVSTKNYVRICKIVGILMDNAIEASSNSKEKHLLIDVYSNETSIVIFIENSFKDSVDVDLIKNKDFSTKGKNRGLGLYIAEKLIKKSSIIKLNQKIDKNVFVSELTISKK